MSFLDENCLVFDNEDENKLEYTGIHNVRKRRIKSCVEIQENGGRPALRADGRARGVSGVVPQRVREG